MAFLPGMGGIPPRKRRSRLLCGIVVGGVLVSGLIAGPSHAVPQEASGLAGSVPALPDPVADGSLSEEDKALQDAQASGQPVELISARTEGSDTWAQPDGSFSVKRHGTAVRLWRDGSWVAADPTLKFAPDGSVVPTAASVAVKFSGGGTGPMLTGVKDGRTLSLTWPQPLPSPTLAGNVATYAEIISGVDLQLKAEVEGFSQLLVVKTAQAAANPALAQLQFAMDTVGLSVSKDADTGSLVATDPVGQTVFTSPTPLMWDSSTPTTPAARSLAATSGPGDMFEPGAGATDAQMTTSVSGGTLTIVPDQGLLTGTDTTYPVYIDPSWAWGERQHWARVYKAYPNTSYWDSKEDVRVGYEAETGGSNRISRSFFQLDTGDVIGAQVKDATFRIRNTWSWSCQKRPVHLYQVGDITKKTTWNNQPSKIGTVLSTVNDSKGWGSDCAAGNLEFDATAAVQATAADNEPSVTLGLYAGNETDTHGWKRLDPKTATLEIKYNKPPKTPTGLGTNPRTSCTAGGGIGNTAVSLHAKIDDPDGGNLTAQFQAFRAGSSTPVNDTSIPAIKGRVATVVLPSASTPSGEYTWRVRAKDHDGLSSAWSTTCEFSLDRTRPSRPPVISSKNNKYPNGEQGWPAITGPSRTEAEFTFSSNGVTDVQTYHWWTDSDPEGGDAPASTPSAFVTPPTYGPHLVYAYSVDEAGNRSDTATYLYYATRAQARDKPGDLNGDGFKDIWNTDTNGTLLTYAGNGNREFSSATHGGGTFPGQQVTYNGDWDQDGDNDLISLEHNENTNKNQMRVYRNNGGGVISRDNFIGLTVKCPVPRPSGRCKGEPGWTGDDHWHNAQQIATDANLNGDTYPDILVKQGQYLWVYYGSRSGQLDETRPRPVLVGESDWNAFTVIVPGDLNDDSIPDLLLRHNATGDLYRSYGKADPNGVLDAAAWGSAASRVKIATGLMPQSLYPTIGSSGDLDGDDVQDGVDDGDRIPDIWARKSDNSLFGWRGVKTGVHYSGLGSSFLIDGVNGGLRIPSGTVLTSGQSLTSDSAKLTMQADGNLVITSNSNTVLWSSGTAGNNNAKARVLASGNLAVYTADDSTQLWSTNANAPAGDGYALLQDRGSLVVYNAKGQSQWSSGTAVRNDINGDGRSDMVEWYDYTTGNDAMHVFKGAPDGGIEAPHTGFASPEGQWTASRMKRVNGDFNGDGHGDVAIMYYYADGTHKLWTFRGQSNGTYAAPFSSWVSTGNRWGAINRSTLQAGDFNGDGRDDIAAWYDYADGNDTLFTFTSNVRGGFNKPFATWTSTTWTRPLTKITTGDFNGDGRDDIAGLYKYGAGGVKVWHFQALPTGGFAAPTVAWTHDTWGDWNLTHIHAGDFNGDGKDDIATWFDYPDGSDTIHTYVSLSTGNGSFAPPKQAWSTPAGYMTYQAMQMIPGDYNGDGRDDLGAMYGYSNGTVKMLTWIANPDATFQPVKTSWASATPTSWEFERNQFINRYTT
ncbi:FG-GAP-like repeat-containing protein [Streptomyces albipurpureus]|uniref:FG-GAP-like repeat-containing protein n=1 Tax=Streptomyces albipurpureus TaxID=2897419 RepID=A0ABT0V1A4_9ACTN|nr:FG-GAP-like repeat-containing protein [Streptomyces sp. CWNU-1]MCM2393176.1 FG-GAP-like repeat-containing protein [Streptomyces sp. CWNU-1]